MSNSGRISVHIPEELVRLIFDSLPVKSLLRCKSVCKLWCSIITGPTFIAKRLRYASCCEDKHHVMLKHCLKTSFRVHVSFFPDKKDANLSLLDAPVEPIAFFEDVDEQFGRVFPKFFGPCDGVLCVAGYSDHEMADRQCDLISLWNPSTREMKRLPPSTRPPLYLVYHEGFDIGFGYDFKGRDYKVVKILHCYGSKFVRTVEVYSLRTDCWRKIDVIAPECMRAGAISSVYLDGSNYWWGAAEEGKIVCFDFANDVLSEIAPPDIPNFRCVTITTFKDSLALLAIDTDENQLPRIMGTALWVLKKDNGINTWTKLFRLSKQYHDMVGMFRNGNLLINLDYWRYKLAVYDLSSREVLTRNDFDGIYEAGFLQVFNYVESLVTFKRTDEVDNDDG